MAMAMVPDGTLTSSVPLDGPRRGYEPIVTFEPLVMAGDDHPTDENFVSADENFVSRGDSNGACPYPDRWRVRQTTEHEEQHSELAVLVVFDREQTNSSLWHGPCDFPSLTGELSLDRL
jgi:hypothetical protein